MVLQSPVKFNTLILLLYSERRAITQVNGRPETCKLTLASCNPNPDPITKLVLHVYISPDPLWHKAVDSSVPRITKTDAHFKICV